MDSNSIFQYHENPGHRGFQKNISFASINHAERNTLQTSFDVWKKTDNGRLRPCAFVGIREWGRMRRVTTNDTSTLAYAFTLTLSNVEACGPGYRFHPSTSEYACAFGFAQRILIQVWIRLQTCYASVASVYIESR